MSVSAYLFIYIYISHICRRHSLIGQSMYTLQLGIVMVKTSCVLENPEYSNNIRVLMTLTDFKLFLVAAPMDKALIDSLRLAMYHVLVLK